ncbi:MAG: heptosyltransferase-3 [Paracoccaceae bacterium]|jgi:heptosyltransferase-3
MPVAPKKVLIHHLGSLGDTAFLMPIFHHLNEIWPDAEKRVLTNFPVAAAAPPLQAVLVNGNFADGYFAYPIGSRNPAALWKLAGDIRAWGPDIAVYANAVKPTLSVIRDGLFLRLCGARGIVGLPLAQRRRRHVFDSDTGLFERETSRIARALEGLGPIDVDRPAGKNLCLTATEQSAAKQVLSGWAGAGKFICFSPGTKQAIKDWTDPNWTSVLERLSASNPQLGIVIVGADGDRARSDALLGCWRGPHLNTCGNISPRVSAAVMSDAVLFLGNDSGPMHLAAAVDTPAVAVFSRHARPGIWFPLGDQHRIFYPGLRWSGGKPPVERETENETDIRSIPADQVIGACMNFLRKN